MSFRSETSKERGREVETYRIDRFNEITGSVKEIKYRSVQCMEDRKGQNLEKSREKNCQKEKY